MHFFRQLNMTQLEPYEIPTNIKDLEFEDDASKITAIARNFHNAQTDSMAYIEKFTALIHMEEAANSKHLATFDLKNVQISLHSRPQQTYKVAHSNNSKFYQAWRKKKIDSFILNPIACQTDAVISGRVSYVDTHYILLNIVEGFEELFSWSSHTFYNISFTINRIVYQLQHNALKWFKEHKLFTILIHNSRFEQKPESVQKPDIRLVFFLL